MKGISGFMNSAGERTKSTNSLPDTLDLDVSMEDDAPALHENQAAESSSVFSR